MFGHLYVGFSRSTPYAADSIIIIIIIIIITNKTAMLTSNRNIHVQCS